MLLVTPYDMDGTSWTKEAPTFTILARLMQLSRIALSTAEESLLNNGSVEHFKVKKYLFKNKKILIVIVMTWWSVIPVCQPTVVPSHFFRVLPIIIVEI